MIFIWGNLWRGVNKICWMVVQFCNGRFVKISVIHIYVLIFVYSIWKIIYDILSFGK
jgi:hypothetical protein